jgi:diphosphomevalonate decarboxylase
MQATAVAHPNVALIKYWGKRDSAENLPAVGSLSLTLGGLHTRTTVRFEAGLAQDQVLINGQPDEQARPRVSRCLDLLRAQARVEFKARVESENDFPTGAGLASSASGYAALVKAAAGALKLDAPAATLNEIARIGSGSAPRSLHGGIVLLNMPENSATGTDMTCATVCAPNEWPLSVVVAVTSHAVKDVGSTGGMELSRSTSPYYSAWVESHPEDLQAGLAAVAARDFMTLAELSEHSCLKMHAVAMTTRPSLFYWSAATVECLLAVRRLRSEGVPVFFTIDAGPQLKAVCLPEAADQVAQALQALPGVLEIIASDLGPGAWLE